MEKEAQDLNIYFADSEADCYIVELAGRLGGYVIGNDSDFVVLNSQGYCGYMPMDEMVWTADAPQSPVAEEDTEFCEVRKAKKRPVHNTRLGRGLIPPELVSGLNLTVSIYNPSVLADHLKLPVNLLPLLGAIVGNDFYNETSRQKIRLIFERRLSPVERINCVSSTIHSIIVSSTRRQKDRVDSVMTLISKTVNSLLSRTPSMMSAGEVDELVDQIAESTLQYAISKGEGEVTLWPSPYCVLHDSCPLLSDFCQATTGHDDVRTKTKDLCTEYLQAYRQGRLSAPIIDYLYGTQWPHFFLESPDIEAVSLVGRPLRQWGYAILHHAVGLPQSCVEQDAEAESTLEEGDDDQLIDVIEHDSENGEDVQHLHVTEKEIGPSITEYVRRGTRIVGERVSVPLLMELLNSLSICHADAALLLRQSSEYRLSVLFGILNSDHPPIRELPRQQWVPVVTLRWVTCWFYRRAQENYSKDRELARWTRREGQCFLASFAWNLEAQPQTEASRPPVLDRNIQLTAQVLHVLECIEQLSQILLLSELVPSSTHLFSGVAFHRLLIDKSLSPLQNVSSMWDASIFGLEDGTFREEGKSKAKGNKLTRAPKKALVRTFELLRDVNDE